MVLNEQLVQEMIQKGENEKVEFKSSLQEPLLLSKLISAFANSEGGKILVGVTEDSNGTKIIGSNYNSIKEVLEKATQRLEPKPEVVISEVSVNNVPIIIIEVEESKKIISATGSFYYRQGEVSRKMNAEEISNILNLKSSKSEKLPEGMKYIVGILEKQGEMIEYLTKETKENNSVKNKMKDYIIGGVIGAVLGLIPTLIQ